MQRYAPCASIQRVTCRFSFRSVYAKNAPHRRICTREEAGVTKCVPGRPRLCAHLLLTLFQGGGDHGVHSDNFAEGFAAEDRVVAGDILISTIKSYL